jgi:hypothetical protein
MSRWSHNKRSDDRMRSHPCLCRPRRGLPLLSIPCQSSTITGLTQILIADQTASVLHLQLCKLYFCHIDVCFFTQQLYLCSAGAHSHTRMVSHGSQMRIGSGHRKDHQVKTLLLYRRIYLLLRSEINISNLVQILN